jgi:hypothetical protein
MQVPSLYFCGVPKNKKGVNLADTDGQIHKCKYCGNRCVKAGKPPNGYQKYKCKSCGYIMVTSSPGLRTHQL